MAPTDKWQGTLNGAATKKILERQFLIYSQPEYERLVSISIAHLYKLRGHKAYLRQRSQFDNTRPTKVAIAERRKPQPQARPCYCESTRFTRVTGIASKGFTTSTPSTR